MHLLVVSLTPQAECNKEHLGAQFVLWTQVVDTVAFAKRQATVDFDVNNLKLTKEGMKVKHENEVRLEGRILEKILRNARTKHLLVLKPAKEVTARIEKMSKRGWGIHFPS